MLTIAISERGCRVGASGAEPRPYLVHDLSRGRHHPNSDQRSPIDDDFAVDENSILAVVPPDRFYFDRELTAEARRHTDGMYSRNSKRAVTNRHPGHGDP